MIIDDDDIALTKTQYASIVTPWKHFYMERLEQFGYPKFQFPIYISQLPYDIAGMSNTTGKPTIFLNEMHLVLDAFVGRDRMLEEILGHEISHAYVYKYHKEQNQIGHGKIWRSMMVTLGIPPKARIHPNKNWQKNLNSILEK